MRNAYCGTVLFSSAEIDTLAGVCRMTRSLFSRLDYHSYILLIYLILSCLCSAGNGLHTTSHRFGSHTRRSPATFGSGYRTTYYSPGRYLLEQHLPATQFLYKPTAVSHCLTWSRNFDLEYAVSGIASDLCKGVRKLKALSSRVESDLRRSPPSFSGGYNTRYTTTHLPVLPEE